MTNLSLPARRFSMMSANSSNTAKSVVAWMSGKEKMAIVSELLMRSVVDQITSGRSHYVLPPLRLHVKFIH